MVFSGRGYERPLEGSMSLAWAGVICDHATTREPLLAGAAACRTGSCADADDGGGVVGRGCSALHNRYYISVYILCISYKIYVSILYMI